MARGPPQEADRGAARARAPDRAAIARAPRRRRTSAWTPGPSATTRSATGPCSRCTRLAGARGATGGRTCTAHRPTIERWLGDGLRLTKIQKLLTRQGVAITYPTLYRFAVSELQFGQHRDDDPGARRRARAGAAARHGLGRLADARRPGSRRRFRAWIFTAVRSRHRFVYPTFEETTARAIEACEAAWAFFGGVFSVIIPDNTKAIIVGADPLDAADHAGVSRVRAGAPLPHRSRARAACRRTKGASSAPCPASATTALPAKSSSTLDDARARAPRLVPRRVRPAPAQSHAAPPARALSEPRSSPRCCRRRPRRTTSRCWSEPKVGRDQLAVGRQSDCTRCRIRTSASASARAPTRTSSGSTRRGLADQDARAASRRAASRSTRSDYPAESSVYALRNVDGAPAARPTQAGAVIGRFAAALLDSPLPWTRMRRVYALLGLVRRYGATRVTEACTVALEADMLDVHRLHACSS